MRTTFEQRNKDVLFKQNAAINIDLDLKKVILLDSQSTMDLFCNKAMVHSITRSEDQIRLKSYGSKMVENQKA